MSSKRIATLGFLLWLSAPLAFAQDASPEAGQQPANAWAMNCSSVGADANLVCQVSQNLTETKTGQRVLTITVRRQADPGFVLLLALPHGLYLPAGATYQIDDGEKASVAVQTSDQNGAYTAIPVNDTLLGALKNGSTLKVGMETMNREPIVLPVSLVGFTAAVNKLIAVEG